MNTLKNNPLQGEALKHIEKMFGLEPETLNSIDVKSSMIITYQGKVHNIFSIDFHEGILLNDLFFNESEKEKSINQMQIEGLLNYNLGSALNVIRDLAPNAEIIENEEALLCRLPEDAIIQESTTHGFLLGSDGIIDEVTSEMMQEKSEPKKIIDQDAIEYVHKRLQETDLKD